MNAQINTLALQISLSAGIQRTNFRRKFKVSTARQKKIKKITYKYLFKDENMAQLYFNRTSGLNFESVLCIIFSSGSHTFLIDLGFLYIQLI